MYTYKATVNKIVDGDTVNLTIDLGFRLSYTANCRLTGINAPELKTEEGQKAKLMLDLVMPKKSKVTISSTGLDKYGRPLVIIWHFDATQGTFNDWMLNQGYAKPYEL